MKKSILLFHFLFLFVISINAQDWLTDFNEAKKVALNENKKIILVFQGSDWCAPCIKLEREIWSSNEFKNYSKEHFVLLKADFPRKKKNKLSKEENLQNKQLMEQYNTKGYFPFVAVLDKKGAVLGTTGYKKTSPKEYTKLLASF